jgi:cholesterol 7-dehydrogenase
MVPLLGLIASLQVSNSTLIVIVITILLYIYYYKKFSFYIFEQKKSFTKGKRNIGTTPPAYPNGWFCIGKSTDVQIGQTKYIDSHGEHVAVFRGTNGKLYALEAYCAHMGANLGIDGQVTNEKCVRCPFHGWVFDGETGNCVVGSRTKEGISFEYVETDDGKCEFQEKHGAKPEKVSIKKYTVMEKCGFMFAWFDCSGQGIPPYEPLDITEYTNKLSYRGTSKNVVSSHVQDVAENGGDLMHFLYIHSSIIPYLVRGFWEAKWLRADDPDLRQKLSHSNKTFHEYRTRVLDTFITEENKKYIGVIHLDNQISVLGSPNIHFFCLTGFQVGPGLVYLFLKSNIFETVLFQHIDTVKKFEQHVYHEIYCSNWNPYWFSALQLRLEAQQVLNDGVVWDNKKFGYNPIYVLNNEADVTLINWRKWYTQFYDGCVKMGPKTLDW